MGTVTKKKQQTISMRYTLCTLTSILTVCLACPQGGIIVKCAMVPGTAIDCSPNGAGHTVDGIVKTCGNNKMLCDNEEEKPSSIEEARKGLSGMVDQDLAGAPVPEYWDGTMSMTMGGGVCFGLNSSAPDTRNSTDACRATWRCSFVS